jgi:hypothetical protein
MSEDRVGVRLLFVDSGVFHKEELKVPASSVQSYDRLIDVLQEDPELLKGLHLDFGRLCAAWLAEGKD